MQYAQKEMNVMAMSKAQLIVTACKEYIKNNAL